MPKIIPLKRKIEIVILIAIASILIISPILYLWISNDQQSSDSSDNNRDYSYYYYGYVPPPIIPTSRDGIPLDWSTVDNSSYISIYNETGHENKVYLSDILNAIALYWEQEDHWLYATIVTHGNLKIHEHKTEYMVLDTVVDEITGIHFTGVNLLDVLCFANCYYAMNISCKSNIGGNNGYFNTTTKDILYKSSDKGGRKPTILAIAANGEFLKSFILVQEDSTNTLYDVQEIRTLTEWEIEIYIDGVEQDFKINRTTIIDPRYPNGWTYGYNKEAGYTGGIYSYNRTFYGTNMSYLLDQCGDIDESTKYNITTIYLVDGNYSINKNGLTYSCGLTYNSTDVRYGLDYPLKYGLVNETKPGEPWDTTELPQTNLLMTMVYKERRLKEYGFTFFGDKMVEMYESPWNKGFFRKYRNGPFSLVIPGITKNDYPRWIIRLDITTF